MITIASSFFATLLLSSCAEQSSIPIVRELPLDCQRITQHEGWNSGAFDTFFAVIDTVYISRTDYYRRGKLVRWPITQYVGDSLVVFGNDTTRYPHWERSYEGIMHWIDTAIHSTERQLYLRRRIDQNRTVYPSDYWNYPFGPPQDKA